MFDLLINSLTGGLTGIVGSLIGKAFSFLDAWQEEKRAGADHQRTLEMLEMQNKMGAEESERELAVAEVHAASDIRTASYSHAASVGVSSPWVVDCLRLVRPILTLLLILLVGYLYTQSVEAGRATIEASVIYMASSATLWWFGDRALRKKT
jgi:hypothetical protein